MQSEECMDIGWNHFTVRASFGAESWHCKYTWTVNVISFVNACWKQKLETRLLQIFYLTIDGSSAIFVRHPWQICDGHIGRKSRLSLPIKSRSKITTPTYYFCNIVSFSLVLTRYFVVYFAFFFSFSHWHCRYSPVNCFFCVFFRCDAKKLFTFFSVESIKRLCFFFASFIRFVEISARNGRLRLCDFVLYWFHTKQQTQQNPSMPYNLIWFPIPFEVLFCASLSLFFVALLDHDRWRLFIICKQ